MSCFSSLHCTKCLHFLGFVLNLSFTIHSMITRIKYYPPPHSSLIFFRLSNHITTQRRDSTLDDTNAKTGSSSDRVVTPNVSTSASAGSDVDQSMTNSLSSAALGGSRLGGGSHIARPHHIPKMNDTLAKRMDEIKKSMGDGVRVSCRLGSSVYWCWKCFIALYFCILLIGI